MFFCLLLAAVALSTASAQEGGELSGLERAADALPLGEQVEAYRALRDRLVKVEGTDDAVSLEFLRGRVERKLALAIRRRATPGPSATERRGMAREAADIGLLYLKENSPESAVAYEKVIEGIESPSPATGLLRNGTRDWFRGELGAYVASRSWDDGRKHITRWSELLGDDPSVAEGKRTYAEARAEQIIDDFDDTQSEDALKSIDAESRSLPDQPAWDDARRRVREALIKGIEKSALETKPDQMRKGIDRFERLFPEDERTSGLMGNYDELVEKTLPAPITREAGMVKNVALRVDVVGLMGSGLVETSDGDEVSEDQGTYIGFNVEYRYFMRNEKQQLSDTGLWMGVAVAGLNAGISDDDGDDKGTILVVQPEFLVGLRGRKWSARGGLGLSYQKYNYDGAAYELDGTGLSAASLSVGIERAFGNKLSVYGQAHYAGVSEYRCMDARGGIRYFPSPNFSLNLGYWWLSTTAEPEDEDTDIDFEIKGPMFGISLQF